LNRAIAPDPAVFTGAGRGAGKIARRDPVLGRPRRDLEKFGELLQRENRRETSARRLVLEGQGDFGEG
jgi:hypothetical protein